MPSRALAEWLGNDAAPTNDSTNNSSNDANGGQKRLNIPSRALAERLGNDAAPTNDSTNDAGSNPSSDHAGSVAKSGRFGLYRVRPLQLVPRRL